MLFELTNPEIAIMMMGLFLFAVLLGFPIAFTLMAMGIGFGYYAYYDPALMENIFDNRIFRLFINNILYLIVICNVTYVRFSFRFKFFNSFSTKSKY